MGSAFASSRAALPSGGGKGVGRSVAGCSTVARTGATRAGARWEPTGRGVIGETSGVAAGAILAVGLCRVATCTGAVYHSRARAAETTTASAHPTACGLRRRGVVRHGRRGGGRVLCRDAQTDKQVAAAGDDNGNDAAATIAEQTNREVLGGIAADLSSLVSKAQLHLDATRAEKTKREEQAEHAALQAYAARSAATEAETMASELMADVEAALAAEMLAENAVIAASDMLVSVRAAEKEERELQLAELSKLYPSGEASDQTDNAYGLSRTFRFNTPGSSETDGRQMQADVARTLSTVAELRETLFGVPGDQNPSLSQDWAETAAAVEAMANAAEAELASKETLLKGDAGSVKEQLLTALDIKYGSMIRRLEVAVKEATAARQMAHEAREDIESRAQEAGKDVGALRDAADEADALAQQAMELAEVAVQDAVQAQEEMKLAQTALNEALASIQETASSLAAKQEEAEMEVAAEQEAAAAAAAAAGTAESATPPPAPSAPAPTGGPLELETLDDSVDQGGFVSPRPLSPSKAASVEVDKVLQEVESVLASVEAEIVSTAEKPRLNSEKEAIVPVADRPLPTLVKTEEAKAAEEKPAAPKNPSPPASSTKFVQGAFFGSFQKISLLTVLKQVAPLVAMGIFLGLVGVAAHKLQIDSIAQLLNLDNLQRLSQAVVREVRVLAEPVLHVAQSAVHLNPSTAGVVTMLWLLGMSCLCVPLVSMLPGGSPVLGFLIGGLLLGPHCLGIIQDVHGVQHLAEFGVIFLLFNIGLELSLERLVAMAKYVFALGTAQVLFSTGIAAIIGMQFGLAANVAIVLGMGLAFSSTAVGMQVLQDRGEANSRHGRATFSVLLLQDLAVVLVFMLVPLLAPTPDGTIHTLAILIALAQAVLKTAAAITCIMLLGRVMLRPLYRAIASTQNAEIFAATTLLTCLGTSLLTESLGLSAALGAFLAGLLLAETEFHLQVESDIAPYRGLLLGLFFMTVGMTVDPKLLFNGFGKVMAMFAALIVGKLSIMVALGPLVGVSVLNSFRSGLFLAPGGEFAFVTFGLAVQQHIIDATLAGQLTLVVALSMAVTPWLAELGSIVAKKTSKQDIKALQPADDEVGDLSGHIIIAGFGRVGQMVSQLLSERLIQFVALDVRSERVQAGRAMNLPVYFGDAGSAKVLHAVGGDKAACAVITLDTPGANYRTVWALQKAFPGLKTFVRAHDIEHGLNLEKAGATAVVPETLEPSLQLAAAALGQVGLTSEEVAYTIDSFRNTHMSELSELAMYSRSSIGYGFPSTPSGSAAGSAATLVDDEDQPAATIGTSEAVP